MALISDAARRLASSRPRIRVIGPGPFGPKSAGPWARCRRAAAAAAAVNLGAAPILGGTDFWSAAGWVTLIARMMMALWFLVTGISMIRADVSAAVEASEPRKVISASSHIGPT